MGFSGTAELPRMKKLHKFEGDPDDLEPFDGQAKGDSPIPTNEINRETELQQQSSVEEERSLVIQMVKK